MKNTGMSLLTLGIHAVVKELMASGFSDTQAEAVTCAVRESQNIDISNLVTKADLATSIAELKADILKWMFGVVGLQTVAVLGTAATLFHLIKP